MVFCKVAKTIYISYLNLYLCSFNSIVVQQLDLVFLSHKILLQQYDNGNTSIFFNTDRKGNKIFHDVLQHFEQVVLSNHSSLSLFLMKYMYQKLSIFISILLRQSLSLFESYRNNNVQIILSLAAVRMQSSQFSSLLFGIAISILTLQLQGLQRIGYILFLKRNQYYQQQWLN